MTITTTKTIERYLGDGSQSTWPITFPFFESKDIKACIINSAGEQVDLTYGTDYTVSISTGSIGGTLYYPLADNQELTIWLSLPLTQGTDFYNTGPLNAEALENAFDRLTLISQQLQEESGRAVKVSTSSTETPEEFMASLYAARVEAVSSASAAAMSENNAAVSENAAATFKENAASSENAAATSAATAQAWAESETAPDPDNAESKSAKQWALIAGDAVPIASTTLAGKVKASASLNVNTTSGEATVPDATTTLAGIACRATDEEANEGESTEKYVSPAHLGAQQDALVELIDSKARPDLSNVNAMGIVRAVGWGMPDYNAGIDVSNEFNNQQTWISTKNGYYAVNCGPSSNFALCKNASDSDSRNFTIKINTLEYTNGCGIFLAEVDDSLWVDSKAGTVTFTFYPFKGEV